MSIDRDSSGAPSGGSYSQIIRASALLGGVQGLVYFVSLLRGKAIAVLLGTNGIGALSLYQSIVQSAQTLTNMGIPTSGVREIAAHQAQGKNSSFNRTIVAVRRLTLVSAALGLALIVATSLPLSFALGQQNISPFDLQLLGIAVFFACLAAGEGAVLQGMQKLKELAAAQVWSALISLPCVVGLSFIRGIEGLALGLAASALLNYAIVRYATRSIGNKPTVSWTEVLQHCAPLLRLGAAVMVNAVAASAVMLATRAIVTRHAGLEENGILQAALMVSGIFVVFLFSAMGTDFLPRLSAVRSKHSEVNRLVNEQIEIAILIATPGLLLTLALCPWLIQLFYASSFSSAVILVPWFLVGNLLQIYSWPLGFIQMVLARPAIYVLTQLTFHAAHIGLILLFFDRLHLYAVALSFVVCYAIYLLFIFLYTSRLTQFRFSKKAFQLVALSFGSLAVSLIVSATAPTIASAALIATLGLVSMVFSAKSLSHLLPLDHKLQPYLAWSRSLGFRLNH